MSQENVDLWRPWIEDIARDPSEWDGWIERLPEVVHPDIEWDVSELGLPDVDPVYYGVAAVQQFWRAWLAAWETLTFDYELIDAGERVVLLLDQRMRGRSGGVEVAMVGEAGKYAQVATFRNRMIVHLKLYASQAEALEAVGLSESGG